MRRKYTLQKGTDRRSAPAMDPVNAPAMMDYCSSFVYTNSQLSTILMDEGRIAKEDDNYRYEIFLKDHLGNTRAVLSDAGDGITQMHQESHYYPFGLKMPYISNDYTSTNTNKYQYNGKEKLSLNNENNIFWYDYGARFFDAALARFHTVDPLAEKYPSIAPYAYCGNSPVNYIDPDGRFFIHHIKQGRGAQQKSVLKIQIYTPEYANSVALSGIAPVVGAFSAYGNKAIHWMMDPSVKFSTSDYVGMGLSLAGMVFTKHVNKITNADKLATSLTSAAFSFPAAMLTLGTMLQEGDPSAETALEAFTGRQFAEGKEGVEYRATGVSIDTESEYYQGLRTQVLEENADVTKLTEADIKSAVELKVENQFNQSKEAYRTQALKALEDEQ